MAPYKQQAKKVVWPKLKYFVKDIPDLKIREDELTITFPDNNAMIRLEGADEPDSLRGLHPHFVVLDEVGQMKRDTWYEAIFPAIQRNNGSVLFIGTPKGDNLFKEMFDIGTDLSASGQDDRWYTVIQHVHQTGVYDDKWIAENKPLVPEAKWEQEYLCKWDAVFTGAYYSDYLIDETKNLVRHVPYNPLYPVITGWDLGLKDYTCIWFAQIIDGKYNFIDYYENSGPDIYHYINVVRNKPYQYAMHIVPHDVKQGNMVTSSTRESVLRKTGISPLRIVKKSDPLEGISVVQSNLYTSVFDSVRCKKGVQRLMAYRAGTDAMTGEPTNKPLHDYAGNSDAADALRTFFLGINATGPEAAMYGTQWSRDNRQHTVESYEYF